MTANETAPDREAAPPPVLTSAGDLAGPGGLGDVAGALTRIIVTLNAQQAELASLHDAVALVEGRTQRHESGQEATLATRRETAELGERVEQEASLRRDLVAAVERQTRREQAERAVIARELEQVVATLDALQAQVAASDQGSARTVAGIAERDRHEQSSDERIAALEQRLAASEEEMRGVRDEQARAAPAVTQLDSSLSDLGERARAAEEGRLRLEQDVAALRSGGDREHELLEVVEQQRAARLRTEERLALFEAALNDARSDLATAAEERSILRQHIAGSQQRLQDLAVALEQQSEAIVEHFRRWTDARSDAGRREVDEIERTNRVARDLLMRLTESGESGHEQPSSGSAG